MNIYFAGKIAKNDWRHDLVPLRGAWDIYGHPAPGDWPTVPFGPGGVFTYVGPFFASCDHGCAHADSTHAAMDQGCINSLGPAGHRSAVVSSCYDAIDRCDVFFVWLDCLTAFGSLVELGYAKAKGKTVIVAAAGNIGGGGSCFCSHGCGCGGDGLDDLWFAATSADDFIVGDNAQHAWEGWSAWHAHKIGRGKMGDLCESPIEVTFWNAHCTTSLLDLRGLVPQHEVLGGRYRLDFALPAIKVAIELDGYDYHASKDAFVKDRARQRALEIDGWRVIRFAGSEVHRNAQACLDDAASFVRSLG